MAQPNVFTTKRTPFFASAKWGGAYRGRRGDPRPLPPLLFKISYIQYSLLRYLVKPPTSPNPTPRVPPHAAPRGAADFHCLRQLPPPPTDKRREGKRARTREIGRHESDKARERQRPRATKSPSDKERKQQRARATTSTSDKERERQRARTTQRTSKKDTEKPRDRAARATTYHACRD